VRPAPAAAVPLEARSLQRVSAYRRTILGITGIMTALAAWAGAGVDFDYNLLRLQAKGVESVVWEERIIAQAGRSAFAAVTTASSLDELRRKQRAFEALGSVSEVESLLRLIPERQDEKIRLLRQLEPSLATVSMAAVPPLEPESLKAPLTVLRRRLDLAIEAAASGRAPTRVHAVRAEVDNVLAKLDGGASTDAFARLQQLQTELAADFGAKLRTFQQGLDPSPITPEDLPAGLRQRYVGKNGSLLMRIHPAVDIWELAGATRFVGDIRSADPDVTGPPVTAFESIRLIRRGFYEGAFYALALVAIITWSVLGNVRATVLTLIPLVVGIIWTLGLMRAFGLQFTLANVWAVPMIIGTAAEYGLNVYTRYIEGHETGRPPLARSGVLAVFLNGLTTIGGFGSLMVARHQGIFGLGLLLATGATASLVASLVVAPVLIEIFGRRQSDCFPISGLGASLRARLRRRSPDRSREGELMRCLLIAVLAMLLVPVAIPREVFATDQTKFEALIKKNAPDVASLSTKFSPKVGCVCKSGLLPGFLAKDGSAVVCVMPSVSPGDGALSVSSDCLDYLVLPK
jgi:hypothetical protein